MQFEVWKVEKRPGCVHIECRLGIEVAECNVGIADNFLLIDRIVSNRSGELCKLIDFDKSKESF
jgi:hypothetical protein